MFQAFLLFLLVASGFQPPPEPPEVSLIRERYNEVKNSLSVNPDMYRTEIRVNPDDSPYPALGHFQESIILYWWSRAGESGLVLAVCTGGYAAHSEYTEVLYGEDGSAQFMLFSYNNGPDATFEERRWYSGGSEIYATGKTLTADGEEFYEPCGFNAPRDPGYFSDLFDLLH